MCVFKFKVGWHCVNIYHIYTERETSLLRLVVVLEVSEIKTVFKCSVHETVLLLLFVPFAGLTASRVSGCLLVNSISVMTQIQSQTMTPTVALVACGSWSVSHRTCVPFHCGLGSCCCIDPGRLLFVSHRTCVPFHCSHGSICHYDPGELSVF